MSERVKGGTSRTSVVKALRRQLYLDAFAVVVVSGAKPSSLRMARTWSGVHPKCRRTDRKSVV